MNIKIKSTLLNASKATNLNFKVVGVNLSDEEITSINSINPKRNKVIERVKAIKNKGASLIFDKVDNSTFRNNLIMLDVMQSICDVFEITMEEFFKCDLFAGF